MASSQRDSSSSSNERQPFTIKYSDKPVFVNPRNRDRTFSWTTNRRNRLTSANTTDGDGDGEGAVGTPTRTGGWMSNDGGGGMGLGEAFQRTDDNGVFMPRTRSGLAERGGTVSESRIPRTRTFSPESAKGSASPSRDGREAYVLNGRGGRAVSAPAIDYESEDTGAVRQTSPSPRPRDRRSNKEGSGSDVSSIDMVEDPTKDDFDRKMSQYARDQARINRMVNNPNPILFTRRAVGPRVIETTRTLARKTSESSLESDFVEPPLRKPSSWGSKARKRPGWMEKIMSPADTSLEPNDPADQPEVAERPRTASDVLLPSVEDKSAMQELTPPSSRPASAQPIGASPEKSKVWDADVDFTAHSLQVSTSPQLRVKSAKVDDIRSREIQNLTARAVATNRLEEIRERNSEGSSLGPAATKDVPPPEDPAPEEYHEKTILEEEGEKIPFTPITIFRAKDYEDYVKRNGLAHLSRSSSSSSSRPGSSGQDDPRDLLRRLSKSLSSSPAPPKKEVNRSDVVSDSKNSDIPIRSDATNDSKKSDIPNRSDPVSGLKEPDTTNRSDSTKDSKPIVQKDAAIQDRIAQPRRPMSDTPVSQRNSLIQNDGKSDVDPEERIAAEAKLFELQDNKSEKNSGASSRSPSPSADETPRPKADPMSLSTPRVTGAYIETPAPTARKARSITPPEAQPRSRPRLINTAKPVSAAEDVRRIQGQSEDNTLEDFNALLEAEAAIEGNTTLREPILDLEYNEHGLPLSQKEIERRIELKTFDRMNQSLKATSSGLRDARLGIERIEQKVSSSIEIAQPSEVKDPIPKPDQQPSWKFIWFRFILSLLAIWCVSELAMCAQFCHPKNSRVNTWQPSDPFFPWAIPTKLDQWTGEVVSSGLGSLASAVGFKGEWEWDLGLFDKVPLGYKGGPINCNDWWLGRSGPVGIMPDYKEKGGGSFDDDEMI